MELPYRERRERSKRSTSAGPRGGSRRPSRRGPRLLELTSAQGLEGIVAKRLDSRYEPGRRPGTWVKVKHTHRQELVIGGWLPGEGRRADRIGALLMGYYEDGGLRYAGRVGTGFTEATLDQLAKRLEPLRRDTKPFGHAPKLPRNAVFVEPCLVAEIEFREWTAERVMRAPSYKGLREDKSPRDVRVEAGTVVAEDAAEPDTPEALFDEVERLSDGSLAVLVDGRRLKLSNWDKVLFGKTGFTKGDLIAYYARVASAVLPHLRDRPLTLKRYPNGVEEQYFYEKNSPSHRPEWVQTATINGVNYTLCQDRATLVWLANLADIELHTSLARAAAPERPTMLVFDLDPGPPAGIMRVLRGGARSPRDVRAARSPDGRQDVRFEGHAGLRAAQHPGHLRADQAVRQAGRRGARAAAPGARRLADDQAAALGQGARGLEPERRPQDDRDRVLGPGARSPDGLDAGRLGGDRALRGGPRRGVADLRYRAGAGPRARSGRPVRAARERKQELPSLLKRGDQGFLATTASTGSRPARRRSGLDQAARRVISPRALAPQAAPPLGRRPPPPPPYKRHSRPSAPSFTTTSPPPPRWTRSRSETGCSSPPACGRRRPGSPCRGSPLATPRADPELRIKLVDRLWETATAENAREVADRTWDLVHDRPDSDPVKRRVVECHEALARMTRLGD